MPDIRPYLPVKGEWGFVLAGGPWDGQEFWFPAHHVPSKITLVGHDDKATYNLRDTKPLTERKPSAFEHDAGKLIWGPWDKLGVGVLRRGQTPYWLYFDHHCYEVRFCCWGDDLEKVRDVEENGWKYSADEIEAALNDARVVWHWSPGEPDPVEEGRYSYDDCDIEFVYKGVMKLC